jgi:hypothetical protein
MKNKEDCKHDWFPVAFDFDCEFAFYECGECGEHVWRNIHPAYPEEAL